MKLKKVAALCAKNERFYLNDEVGEDGELIRQWLGDGRALYPLSGLPVLDEDNLCAMFDIPEKKRKKCFFSRNQIPEEMNVEDSACGERMLNDRWPTVEYKGYVIKPLSTQDGITFIQNAYLSPLDDMDDYLRFYERVDDAGQTYIVAKNGMEIAAVIMPVNLVEWDFVRMLEELTEKCRLAFMMQVEKKQERREIGPLFQQGGDAGEGAGE